VSLEGNQITLAGGSDCGSITSTEVKGTTQHSHFWLTSLEKQGGYYVH